LTFSPDTTLVFAQMLAEIEPQLNFFSGLFIVMSSNQILIICYIENKSVRDNKSR